MGNPMGVSQVQRAGARRLHVAQGLGWAVIQGLSGLSEACLPTGRTRELAGKPVAACVGGSSLEDTEQKQVWKGWWLAGRGLRLWLCGLGSF